ncbi:MAG: hypothetical protein COT41_03785 [Candidatus Portnoybacteria bacterium CG08_land_8_20_14_0_20_40_83]|uniref:PqqD family protein n=2 Tax=Candidatus Portnoyibacteriota TaxID=1817913 RepID=A0A2M7YPU6_9BACT|nr:MAG: hypothetical protein COT41_03785 [Candidatus Portnoybacteria bacterium CG08_land_8_20_14_0_20_40_83]PIY75308.1 MAG: hypothetical protein COY85_00610 [Candidatus Portnoybacteria bacterium CG_4_10_14_0_8_um_filter_40_50]PJA64987.1 MAG: hypothetical protein CO159_00125 [Candidatus Portnoybacteria bacterium CG_4_9_14_3_um_filter_40_10]
MEKLNSIYRKNPTVVTKKIGDRIIIVPTQQQTNDFESVFSLNDMAAGIWVMIDGQTPLSTIKERIFQTFDVAPKQAHKDLTDFVLRLKGLNMILLC